MKNFTSCYILCIFWILPLCWDHWGQHSGKFAFEPYPFCSKARVLSTIWWCCFWMMTSYLDWHFWFTGSPLKMSVGGRSSTQQPADWWWAKTCQSVGSPIPLGEWDPRIRENFLLHLYPHMPKLSERVGLAHCFWGWSGIWRSWPQETDLYWAGHWPFMNTIVYSDWQWLSRVSSRGASHYLLSVHFNYICWWLNWESSTYITDFLTLSNRFLQIDVKSFFVYSPALHKNMRRSLLD